ncbi:nucleoporin 35 [Leptinotarsa decemlineata]|uniref:nucleoporin 35 n=1 Tax=Leptinotarsa decemlineata TaxID=7539 RepID=UPI000C251B8B|nr:nucleoporin NUP53 [Leptinotarsa decemlineata]
MEPMALGSNPSSPISPGINPNFLPGFLMGVDTQAIPPNPTVSPGRNRISGSFPKAGLSSTEPRSLRQKLFNQTLVDSPTALSSFAERTEKTGPPKTGLFDSFEQKKRASPIMSSTVAQMNDTMGFNESISRVNEDSMNYSRMASMNESRIRANSINSSRGERVDSHWVTVFGFPPSALTLVLSQLANFGPIADKKVPPHGNWVHVKYNNLSEVAMALSLNCKLINNSIMIGVTLYYNRDDKENESTIYTSPIRARSLRHSFISPSHPNSVISPQILPQKSTGIVTKAMEYVFGW